MVEKYGCTNLINDLRSGCMSLGKAADKAIQAWLNTVQHTLSRPRTEGLIEIGSTFMDTVSYFYPGRVAIDDKRT